MTKLIVIGMTWFCTLSAWASLGDSEPSVEADRAAVNGARKAFFVKSYRVHEITSSNGTSIKEYAGPDGKIFAVTWRGMSHPDLKVILGNYLDEFQQSQVKFHQRGRSPQSLKTENVVFERGGHMRDIRGRAYLPAMIPSGISLGDIE